MTDRFTLPFPPTLNRMYPTSRAGRRYLSADGKAYKETVGKMMQIMKPQYFTGALKIKLILFRPQKQGDIDNFSKAALDALKGHCYADDRQIVELHLYRFDDKNNPRVEVEISEV